jgi:hypothetical protein
MKLKLSIGIPTVVGREESFNNLLTELRRQIKETKSEWKVELRWIKDNKELTIGEKRKQLYENCNGLYSVQIDDDDMVDPYYIKKMLEAIESDKDCITYNMKMDDSGVVELMRFSCEYEDWIINDMRYAKIKHLRTPSVFTPIKTELCKQIDIKHTRYGEDIDFSRKIKPLIKNEFHIEEYLYFYNRIQTETHDERYGIKKLVVNEGDGSTSCLSVRLDNVVGFYKENGRLPDEICSRNQFKPYREYDDQDVSAFIFNHYEPKQAPFVEFNHGNQYSWYDEINIPDLSKLANVVCPISSYIGDKSYNYMKEIGDRTAILYRGNDKILEIERTPYEIMEQMAIESGSTKFILQTDELEFHKWFIERFPDTIWYDIPVIKNNSKYGSSLPKKNKLNTCIKFIASLRAIATAPKIIMNTGNIGLWTTIFRGNIENVWQYHPHYKKYRKL